jgi:proline racemase
VDPSHYRDLIALGRELKGALNDSEHAEHPSDPRLSGIYGTILYEDLGWDGDQVHQRNVTVFADGEVDRSPCGSGTCARSAVLADEGRVAADGPTLRHESLVGSLFIGTVVTTTTADGRHAIVRRSPAWLIGPGSTASSSTRPIPWCLASCCDEPALGARCRRRAHSLWPSSCGRAHSTPLWCAESPDSVEPGEV